MLTEKDLLENIKMLYSRKDSLETEVNYWKSVVKSILDNDGMMTEMQKDAVERYFNDAD